MMLKRVVQSVRTRGVGATLPLAPAVAIEGLAGILAGPVRRRYSRRLHAEACAPLRPGPAIELTVATFAQELDVPELVVSVRTSWSTSVCRGSSSSSPTARSRTSRRP